MSATQKAIPQNGFCVSPIKVERDYIDTQNNYYGNAPDEAELAQELDQLLQSLELTVSDPDSETGKAAVKDKTMQEIEKKPVLKQKLLAALKAGSIKAVEEFCKHPVASVLLAAFKAAFPDEKKA
ncbi:MAG: hypothetical protein HC827_21790 [Cyanobacteria bacterium RM1_2_2]|nr:hypothetical protein [Cyanobacteria bacterium RM1_2_2]